MPITSEIRGFWGMSNGDDATSYGNDGASAGSGTNVLVFSSGFAEMPPYIPNGLSWLAVPASTSLQIGNHDMSVWGWYKQGGDDPSASIDPINANFMTFQVFLNSGDITNVLQVAASSGPSIQLTYRYTFTSSRWVFWMADYTVATRTVRFFVDSPTTVRGSGAFGGGITTINLSGIMKLGIGGGPFNSSFQSGVGIAAKVFTDEERECIFNGGTGDTYPGFCKGNVGWLLYGMRGYNGADFTAENYGTPTQFVFDAPELGFEYTQTKPMLDTNSVGPGEPLTLKLRRLGSNAPNTDTRTQAATKLKIEWTEKTEQ